MLCLVLYNFEQQLLIPSPKKTEDLTLMLYLHVFVFSNTLSVFSIPFVTLLFIYVLDPPPPPLLFIFFSHKNNTGLWLQVRQYMVIH